jgi:predicted homoserine dehydrogenase-like protein
MPRAAGGYDVRGEAVLLSEAGDAVPIGLLDGVRVVHSIEKGQTLTWDDVEIPDSAALTAALALRNRALLESARA